MKTQEKISELKRQSRHKSYGFTPFDPDLYKVKAIALPDNFNSDLKRKIICGFLYQKGNNEYVKNDNEDRWVNPYTICRNTGVKIKGVYLYENDLVNVDSKGVGRIVWGDFEKAWCIQTNANYSGRSPIRRQYITEIIGNYTLSDDDANMFQKYSDDEDAKYSGIKSEPECRSTAHINKLAKQFMPR